MPETFSTQEGAWLLRHLFRHPGAWTKFRGLSYQTERFESAAFRGRERRARKRDEGFVRKNRRAPFRERNSNWPQFFGHCAMKKQFTRLVIYTIGQPTSYAIQRHQNICEILNVTQRNLKTQRFCCAKCVFVYPEKCMLRENSPRVVNFIFGFWSTRLCMRKKTYFPMVSNNFKKFKYFIAQCQNASNFLHKNSVIFTKLVGFKKLYNTSLLTDSKAIYLVG